ncbi:hypothetical protein CPLU01_13121 [Colletotrichum plurivorum]|uniref:Thiol-specific monooxygenase n=1 Tax=Colletotrichum plurivorum TaxID=2175906 RepID=A0A8H6JUD9_9PEZI|nr:hypothetical protein CPLU01_13121 [Colletotrichum plurivorum]
MATQLPPKRRVAVIGAGPAGAIATDALVKEQAFDTVRVFDRRHRAGGTWVLTKDDIPGIPSVAELLSGNADLPLPVPQTFPSDTPLSDDVNSLRLRYADTAAHEHLHSNLPPEIMAFSQEPIPEVVSEFTKSQYGDQSPFRHREVIRQWVEDVFTRGGHSNLVEYNTTVELAEKRRDEWVLTLRRAVRGGEKNEWWQENFDALIVASGHYHLPWIPNIPGLATYEARFPGRIQHTKHYLTAEDYKDKRVVVVGGSISAFDTIHDLRLTAKTPVISSVRGTSAVFGNTPFLHPHIQNRPQIASVDAETGRITFLDGTWVDDVDVLLFATGYDFSFSFLPEIKSTNKRIPGLYQHVFLAKDPSVAFLGMCTGGFGLRIFEWQAAAAARVFAGRGKLPSRKDMEIWEERRVAEKGDSPAFWTLLPDFEVHFEALRAIAGDPAPGTTGRVLPVYDPAWADKFWALIKFRKKWWEREAREARARAVSFRGSL